MTPNAFTHRGTIHIGLRTGRINLADLRETPTCWVTRCGTKYRKLDGMPTGVEWPREHLDLNSVHDVTSIDENIDEVA